MRYLNTMGQLDDSAGPELHQPVPQSAERMEPNPASRSLVCISKILSMTK